MYDRFEQLIPTFEHPGQEYPRDHLPKVRSDASRSLLQRLLEFRAGHFLNLIHQKGQERQVSQVGRQVVLPVTIVMFNVVALVFQGVKRLVLNVPATAPSSHDSFNGIFG